MTYLRLLATAVIVISGFLGSYWIHSQDSDTNPTLKPPPKEPGGGDYWATRYTYPTFEFNPQWLTKAMPDHTRMLTQVPLGIHRAESKHKTSNLSMNLSVNNSLNSDALPTDRFTLLGPRPLNFGDGSNAGRVNAILSDPNDDSVAYLGADGGGVWKTTNCCDADTRWTAVTDDPQFNSTAIGTMHMDPNDSNTIYAGTGDLRYGSFSFGSAGLLRSRDAGATWTVLGEDVFSPVLPDQQDSFPQYQAIGQVRVDPRNSQTIIVGTKTGLFLSYDDGLNWAGPCLTNPFDTQRQDVTGLLTREVGSQTQLIAAIGTRGAPTAVQPDLDQTGANGIYRGTLPNSGCPTDWQLISRADNGWPIGSGAGTPNGPLGRIDLAMAPTDSNIIYAELVSPTSLIFMGIWRSIDGGDTWTQRTTPDDLSECNIGGQSWYYAGLSVSPTDPDQVFLSGLHLFRSDDGANTFTGASCNDRVHVDHHARTYVNNDPSRLLIGNDGGIYYTDNADTASVDQINFTQLNSTLSTIEFYSGDITADFATRSNRGAAGGAQDNGSSVVTWNGPVEATNWIPVLGGDGIYARIEPVLEQRWYVEFQLGNIFVSQTGPLGEYQPVDGPWLGTDTLSFLFPFEIYKHDCPAATGCEHLIAGSNRVWESINGGLSTNDWYSNSPNLTKNTLDDRSYITQLAFSFSDENIAIVGTNDGNVWFGFDLGQGTADSANWVNLTDNNTALPNRPVLDVVTDPLNPLIGYAAVGGFDDNTPTTPGHVFRVVCNISCDSFTWENKSGNLPNIPVNSIMTNPNLPNQVFAGSDWGLYFTNNINANSPVWMRFTEGLPTAMIWDMAIDRGFSTLAVFTRSRGAFAWPLPQVDEGLQFNDPQGIFINTSPTRPDTTQEVVLIQAIENSSNQFNVAGFNGNNVIATISDDGQISIDSNLVGNFSDENNATFTTPDGTFSLQRILTTNDGFLDTDNQGFLISPLYQGSWTVNETILDPLTGATITTDSPTVFDAQLSIQPFSDGTPRLRSIESTNGQPLQIQQGAMRSHRDFVLQVNNSGLPPNGSPLLTLSGHSSTTDTDHLIGRGQFVDINTFTRTLVIEGQTAPSAPIVPMLLQQTLVRNTPMLPGDFNRSGSIDNRDRNIIIDLYGLNDQDNDYSLLGDIDNNGVIDVRDSSAVDGTSSQSMTLNNGFSGSWFNTTRNGEGWNIAILPGGQQAIIAFFSYAPDGNTQVWIVGVGNVIDNEILFTDLSITNGTVFGDAFDPNDVIRDQWGDIRVYFTDCNNGTISYSSDEQFEHDARPIQRLTRLAGVDCEQPNSTPAALPNQVTTGSWFDRDRDGEGWILEALADDLVVLYWYTYDVSGGTQYWLGGVGNFDTNTNTVQFDTLNSTTGAQFGDAFTAEDVVHVPWGTATFQQTDCNNGVFSFNSSLPGFGNSTYNLTRLTGVNGINCNATQFTP